MIWMVGKKEGSMDVDIFGLLSGSDKEAAKKDECKPDVAVKSERQKLREELLAPTGMKELFFEGGISVNKFTCIGVQCKLCIKACPTNALFWKSGEVGVMEDLCVYCGACVLSCMVDDCIKVWRKRESGEVEKFGRVRDVTVLAERLGGRRRFERVASFCGSAEAYCERFGPGLKK
jgi:ferredoxin